MVRFCILTIALLCLGEGLCAKCSGGGDSDEATSVKVITNDGDSDDSTGSVTVHVGNGGSNGRNTGYQSVPRVPVEAPKKSPLNALSGMVHDIATTVAGAFELGKAIVNKQEAAEPDVRVRVTPVYQGGVHSGGHGGGCSGGARRVYQYGGHQAGYHNGGGYYRRAGCHH